MPCRELRFRWLRCCRTDANNEIVGRGFGDALARVLSQCRNQPIAVVDNDLVAVTHFPAVPDRFHGCPRGDSVDFPASEQNAS
jgi:hypothetical protein